MGAREHQGVGSHRTLVVPLALAGAAPSGYLAPPRLITSGETPAGPMFDPATRYRIDCCGV